MLVYQFFISFFTLCIFMCCHARVPVLHFIFYVVYLHVLSCSCTSSSFHFLRCVSSCVVMLVYQFFISFFTLCIFMCCHARVPVLHCIFYVVYLHVLSCSCTSSSLHFLRCVSSCV